MSLAAGTKDCLCNGTLTEEVFVAPYEENDKNKIFNVVSALCELKQAFEAW